jgi:integrase
LKPKTAAAYDSLVRSRIEPGLGERTLASLRPSDVQEWVNGMQAEGLSPSRIRQANIVVGLALQSAVRDGIIARNVARGIRLPKMERREAPALEPEQVEAIAAKMAAPYDLLVRVLGTVGLRFGEAAALRRRSVDLLGRRLVVSESLAEVGGRHYFGPTKSHAVRRAPLTSALVAALEAHLGERVSEDLEALVFTAPAGGPLRHSTFRSRYWVDAVEATKLPPVGLHVLRHSAAAALICAGASPKAVQTVLGHASAAFTLTVYGHVFEADLDDVAALLEASLAVRDAGPMRDRSGTGLSAVPGQRAEFSL